MKENKNIERLFQEKFKDFEATPPSMAWDAIASKLEKKKEVKKVVPSWIKITGIAASLLLISYGILEFYSTKTKETNTIVTQDKIKDSNTKGSVIDDELILNTNETNESIANDSKNETLKKDNPSNHSTLNKENNTLVALDKNEKETSNNATNEKLRFENEKKNNDLVEQKKNITKSEKASNNTLIINNLSNEEIVGLTNLKSENTNNELIVQNSDTKKEIIENTNSKETILKNEILVNINTDVQFTNKNSALDHTNLVTNSEETNSTTEKRLALNNSNNTENNIVAVEGNTNATINSLNDNTNPTNNLVVTNEKTINKNTIASTTSNKLKTNNETEVAKETIDYNKEIITNKENPTTNGNHLGVIKDSTSVVADVNTEANALEQLLKEKEEGKNADEKEKEKRSKWAVSSNAAPVYFNSMAQGSPIDEQFAENAKSYATSLSYGLGLEYSLTKKLSIRSGINSIAVNYDTNEVYYTNSLARVNPTTMNVSRNENAENLVLNNRRSTSVESLSFDVENFTTENVANLNQKMGYVEVPLELSYKIIDNKFGIDFIGGMSTLFLNENEITLVSNGSEMVIGEANNLNSIHFSSNVGLGFKYSFWKSFNANFQPMFKYQINTFNEDSGNFKPFIIGLYSGISFNF